MGSISLEGTGKYITSTVIAYEQSSYLPPFSKYELL